MLIATPCTNHAHFLLRSSYASYILVMIRIIKLERSLIKMFAFMFHSLFGLNVFYSREKDWVWHKTRNSPLRIMSLFKAYLKAYVKQQVGVVQTHHRRSHIDKCNRRKFYNKNVEHKTVVVALYFLAVGVI